KAGGVYKSVARSMLELGRFCRRNELETEFENNGILQVATDAKQLARIQLQVKRAERAGAGAFQLFGKQQAQTMIGSPAVLGALRVNGALVNPHRLVRGLARVVRGQGVTIHEQTPVTTIVKSGDKWQITTPHGTVTATQVVVATNAWQGTFPELY